MKIKDLVLLTIIAVILNGTIAYGEDPYDKVEEAIRRQEKLLYEHAKERSIATYRRYFIIIVIIIAAFVYIPRAIKKEKEKAKNEVKDVIRTELDERIAPVPKLETCKNCGRMIGKLEKSYVFEGQTVCGQCHQKLKNQA